MVSRAQRETTKSKYMHPQFSATTRLALGVGCGFLYFRNKAILGLPVSTTSYSRYAVSTFQSPISTADNDRSLIDTNGAKTPRNPVLLPYLYIIIIPHLVSNFHSFHIKFNNHVLEYEYISYLSQVTGNYSTSKYPISRE